MTMSRNRAYSEDDRYSPDRYSEDFVSDDDQRTPTPKRGHTPRHSGHHQYYQDRFRGRGRGSGAGPRGRGRGRGAKRGRGNSRASEPADMRKSHDTVTTRVLSASRNKINELRNKVEELKMQIRDLEQENKLYKKMQFRQEKAIRGFEDKENDLPRILDKHNNEIRSMREQNRKLKEKFDKSDRYLRDAEDELERVKKKMLKYKEMCEQKELLERDELSRKLTKAEIDMEERDVKIKELQRHVEMLKKNHKHELGIEIARQKEVKKQMEELSEKNTQLENQLKEKEKALEYQNIYSQRRASRENSPDGSPNRKLKKKASSVTDLTPRDKAKFYAEKRRAEMLKQKELKEQQEKKKRQKWEEEEKERKEREREREKEREEQEREKDVSPQTPPEFSFKSIDRGLEEREERRRREEEDRRWKEREEKERRDKEEMQRMQKELERRRDQENREKKEREDRDRRERELRERTEREDRERRERDERERREQEERERLERERREREKAEQEHRLKMERQKLDNDPKMVEERRKKDELLKKLQAMDELGSAGTNPFAPSSPTRKSKEHSFDSMSKRSEPKEYSFTKPVNNLHQGKPSHEDVHVPYLDRQKQKRQSSDDDIAGYQPSFAPGRTAPGAATKTSTSKPLSIFDDDEPAFKQRNKPPANMATKNDKQSNNLLENLFGPQANTSKNMSMKRTEENETFFITNKSSSSSNKMANGKMDNSSNFPWDMSSPSPTKMNKSTVNADKGSTIFGGGAALLDDDHSAGNNKVLPRRGRQQNINTFSAKPSVTAVDAFDDEIEEVVL